MKKMVSEEIKEEFHKRQRGHWNWVYIIAALGLLMLLNDKVLGRIKVIEYIIIGLAIIALNIFVIKTILIGIFSIKNKIANINAGMYLINQEHYGWQAVLTGIFFILVGLFLIGIEIFIIMQII